MPGAFWGCRAEEGQLRRNPLSFPIRYRIKALTHSQREPFFRANDGQISTCFQCQLHLKGCCQQSETSNIGKIAIFLEVSHPSLYWIFFLQTPNLRALTSKNTSLGKVLLLPAGAKTQPSPTLEETFTLYIPVSFVFKVIFSAAGA